MAKRGYKLATRQCERSIQVMKNKLICHYKNHELLSKKVINFPYLKESFDSFAKSMKITQTKIEH